MRTVAFAPEYTDLASRYIAAELRRGVTAALSDGKQVTVDLSNVLSMSESYADEVFGVLVVTLGIQRFVQMITIKNANEHILRVIAKALKDRLEQASAGSLKDTLHTLVAAKNQRSRVAYR
ncbi:DUF4325 domain-containing protein [Ralstonia pickettii]|uniref:DUF4325 domain-containing protein n=1 Tax=Ralstonia pickettii TaxID=329 RepID=A0A7X2HQ89_RALPI|nr:STAS-like domain-containing protein [Ralstonia pickettii]MRT00677.1 DUF4325 domain-containing protein [Ralstonia pickettii]